VEFRNSPIGAAATQSINKVSLLTVQLTDYLTASTDYFFNERTTDDILAATFTTGGSITFTPSTASHDWLIMTLAQYDPGGTGTPLHTRMNQGGGSVVLPRGLYSPNNADSTVILSTARVLNLPASSTTILEESLNATPLGSRLYSNILAVDLNKFAAYASAYTEADVAMTSTGSAYGDALQTASITPTTTSDVWILGYFGFDQNDAARTYQYRIQVDNSDQPSGQTTDAYVYDGGKQAGDETPVLISTMANLSAAAHTIDFDGGVDATTGTPAGQERQLVAVQLSTADAAGGTTITGLGRRMIGWDYRQGG
jgi:hypothetical protein